MGIYIVNKTFLYSNEVGGALRGTRQGPVLEYLCLKREYCGIYCKYGDDGKLTFGTVVVYIYI
jgi:hypothetical protein